MSYNTTAIVVAAGDGKRMKSELRKPFIELCKKPLITYCLDVLERSAMIDDIILVLNKKDLGYAKENIINRYGYTKIVKIARGGDTRQESVYNGLMECPWCDIVLIHDAVRPFIDDDMIERSIRDAHDFGASIVGIPATNTVKLADESDFIESTPDRERVWEIQTPQTFRARLFLEACEYAKEKGIVCTDDAGLVENFGLKVKVTRGKEENIKITTPKDLYVAEMILAGSGKTC